MATRKQSEDKEADEKTVPPVCGIIMPISSLDSYTEGHWLDVRQIIIECIEAAGFQANMVSNANETGVIQKRIVQNLYDNPIVVCDVSGKNPNVMFELGLRLAFDKPTVIIKDNITTYTFDTSVIEHLEYPRDLRYGLINDFKTKLIHKIRSTYTAAQHPDYSTFLKHFGEFKVAKIATKEVGADEFILDEIKGLRTQMESLMRDNAEGLKKKDGSNTHSSFSLPDKNSLLVVYDNLSLDENRSAMHDLGRSLHATSWRMTVNTNGFEVRYKFLTPTALKNAVKVFEQLITDREIPLPGRYTY